MYDAWSYLMEIRKFPIFSNPNSNIQTWLNGSVKKIHYNYEEKNAILIANFDSKKVETNIKLPHKGTWFNVFLDDSVKFDSLNIPLNLPAGRFVLLADFETPKPKKDITQLSIVETDNRVIGIDSKVYPNPSNSTFVINYSLPEAAFVSLNIYDILGREVAQLKSSHQKRGNHKTTWDGRDFSNNKSSPGIYFVKIQIGDYQSNQKIILLK